ncbi:capsular polysaccharide export protein, LipB/KpsS family [Salinicola endophyticus]|uniref:capsular polysaccharide export protein, LipB/KpsS family n=1 Tax=Salinicola endophyticus TaxID=1949083 RepID=UPI000DA1CB6B|nr:hypothetical protein [Salinicola endophyticus]
MSKVTKFFKHPVLFFKDAKKKKLARQNKNSASNTPKKPSAKAAVSNNSVAKKSIEIPEWFRSDPGIELRNALNSGKPVILYIPWITEHSNALINAVGGDYHYALAPLDFIRDLSSNRRSVLWFARENPELYRKMIAKRLVPIMDRVAGIVFTFDWPPVMRIISYLCEELSIPRILIPHESVFVSRDKYYWDPKSFASQPIADVVLGWGDLQKGIFLERGFPEDRYRAVGAPKFDKYINYRSKLSRSQFYRLFGLSPGKKTILYASQPLDSQLNTRLARESQRQSISDLLKAAEELSMQLIVRLPPSKDDILGHELYQKIIQANFAAVDDAVCYLVSPEDALNHTEVVASVNSTMLFEGLLMGRMPISTKYVEFKQIWEKCKFPIVRNHEQVVLTLEDYLVNGFEADSEGLKWASKQFSNGSFDGLSSVRIKDYLKCFVENKEDFSMQSTSLEKLFNRERIDLVGIHSPENSWSTIQKYLPQLVNANQRVFSGHGMKSILQLASVDLFLQWGISPANTKKRQRQVKNALGRQMAYIEDGFIRSVNIGLKGEPGLSLILDDTTSYYDATQASRMERLLNSTLELTEPQRQRAEEVIGRIVRERISKYNHAPIVPFSIGTPGRKKVLLVDQRKGDQSVEKGLANETSFNQMLLDAINDRSNCDIIIKQHPDSIGGGKGSYYNNESLAFTKHMSNVYLIDYDINPYSLLDAVDEVFVVTSGLGFEALMSGKEVRCYGAPFYSNWGVTTDKVVVERRKRERSVVEIFHVAYIELSRYCDPRKEVACEIEDLIDYISSQRNCSAVSV